MTSNGDRKEFTKVKTCWPRSIRRSSAEV
jgi:hypothetical protein